jgi:hypothetical protein
LKNRLIIELLRKISPLFKSVQRVNSKGGVNKRGIAAYLYQRGRIRKLSPVLIKIFTIYARSFLKFYMIRKQQAKKIQLLKTQQEKLLLKGAEQDTSKIVTKELYQDTLETRDILYSIA